ncbi:hypothetical protein INT08_10350 [Prosthecochloris sp. N3]|uniref:Uncharacterized protein n=2 Tax=Chlorobiaceae TaxID=191412 RepID=A0ABR9XUB3_9CHLB|nr:hypothetical protein [Prosthecochloris ethylica]MBF0637569.1 hypothetical protein [Prosthecochloris ethylica]NUK47506.1 hypothetical protein [Prosthecochloris ethylica]
MPPEKHPREWKRFLASSGRTKPGRTKGRIPDTVLKTSVRRPFRPRKFTRKVLESIFLRYLRNNPKVMRSLLWSNSQRGWYVKSLVGNGKYWRSYLRWPASVKNELKELFIDHALHPESRMVSVDPTKTSFSFDEIRKFYLASVAHSLYLDIFSLVPWKLRMFDESQLRWLLDGRYFAFNFALDIDRQQLPDAISKYGFGYVERMRTEVDPWGYYAIATPALPGDPALLFSKLAGLGTNRSTTMQGAISIVSRWCQEHLAHGSTAYTWGGGMLHGSSWIDQLYPSSEVMFLGEMEPAFIDGFRQKLDTAYISPCLPSGVTVDDLVDSGGVLADPAMGSLDAQGTLQFPSRIGFMKHCTYGGCQSTGGLLHWLFKCLNIPARQYSCFLGDVVAGNYPGIFHKGIEVSVGQPETLVVSHSDHFYQGMHIYHPDLPDGGYLASLLDPHIDPIKVFLPKNFQEWWLPPYNSSSASQDPALYGKKQNELYQSQFLMIGATGAFSSFVIDFWKAYEQAGRSLGAMDTDTIPWMVLLKKLSMPANVLAGVLGLAEANILSRIGDIENGINTLWGTTLSAYEAGFMQWDQNLYQSKIRTTLWSKP